jgi:predicted transcriptional regulator
MQPQFNKTAYLIIGAISYLYQNNKDINPHSISKKANIDWRTAKRYMINNFNIKENNDK